MVTDLQREEDQTSMLKKALAEAHEAEQEAHTTADVARAAEQHAMKELGRMVEVQVTLTDQLENATRKLEAEEAQTRLLRAAISAADHDRQNENNVHSDTVRTFRNELANAVNQQQELLDQLVEKDEQVRCCRIERVTSAPMCNLVMGVWHPKKCYAAGSKHASIFITNSCKYSARTHHQSSAQALDLRKRRTSAGEQFECQAQMCEYGEQGLLACQCWGFPDCKGRSNDHC